MLGLKLNHVSKRGHWYTNGAFACQYYVCRCPAVHLCLDIRIPNFYFAYVRTFWSSVIGRFFYLVQFLRYRRNQIKSCENRRPLKRCIRIHNTFCHFQFVIAVGKSMEAGKVYEMAPRFKCRICSQGFMTSIRLKSHEKAHLGVSNV